MSGNPQVLDTPPHAYRVYDIDADDEWFNSMAIRYLNLRAEPANRSLEAVIAGVSGLLGFDGTRIAEILRSAVTPIHTGTSLEVLRSDLGEQLCYEMLEAHFGTAFGYKSIRDRELVNMPGRGIDAFGVEDTVPLSLIIAEAKVSAEGRNPPRVVEGTPDSLREQHLAHLENRTVTSRKILNAALRTTNSDLGDQIMAAALLFEAGDWSRLRVVTSSLLVRPKDKYQQSDFGTFRSSANDFRPAEVRFLIVNVSVDIGECIGRWHQAMQNVELGRG